MSTAKYEGILSALAKAEAGDFEPLFEQALTGGFASKQLRKRAWALLMRLPQHAVGPPPSHLPVLQQIALDVPRSMHFDACDCWTPPQRAVHLAELCGVLSASFPVSPTGPQPRYLQGFHDTASILLLVLGPARAVPALQRLLITHLYGFTRDTLAAPSSLLHHCLLSLVCRAHPAAGARLAASPHALIFALPWILTWFAHSLHPLPAICRLYDVFLCCHPLLPLYVSAALLTVGGSQGGAAGTGTGTGAGAAAGDQIAAIPLGEDGELSMLLQSLPQRMPGPAMQQLLDAAYALYRACPPWRLLSSSLPPADRAAVLAAWPQLASHSVLFPDPLLTPAQRLGIRLWWHVTAPAVTLPLQLTDSDTVAAATGAGRGASSSSRGRGRPLPATTTLSTDAAAPLILALRRSQKEHVIIQRTAVAGLPVVLGFFLMLWLRLAEGSF